MKNALKRWHALLVVAGLAALPACPEPSPAPAPALPSSAAAGSAADAAATGASGSATPHASTLQARTSRGRATPHLTAVDGRREGGQLVLADVDGRRLALIADEDAHAVRVVDPRTHVQLGVQRLTKRPGQLVIGGDGRLYVALRGGAEVMAFEVAAAAADGPIELRENGRFATAVEPIALASSAGGRHLLVASGWGRRLQRFALSNGERTADVALPPEPRGLTVSADGDYAFVSHAKGPAITRVALQQDGWPLKAFPVSGADHDPVRRQKESRGPSTGGVLRPRHAGQGYALAAFNGDVMGPAVVVRVGVVPYRGSSRSYATAEPVIALLPNGAKEVTLRAGGMVFPASKRRFSVAADLGDEGCFLPRAMAIAPKRKWLLISCLGVDRVDAYTLEPRGMAASMAVRWKVPAGALGLALDSAANEALVWAQFSGELVTLPLPAKAIVHDGWSMAALLPKPRPPSRTTKLPPVKRSAAMVLSNEVRRGRELFHAANDKRLSGGGQACASCHPDGRDDGLNWPTTLGLTQTVVLAGRLGDGSAPFGWTGDAATLAEHVGQTLVRLRGRGLAAGEIAALVAYVKSLPPPPTMPAPAADAARVARGRELFHADTVGCASCHKDGDGNDGVLHDVGSGAKLNTPSLRAVGGSAPYYHDGRYATLMDLLRATKGKMGWGGHLSEQDLRAVEAYMNTL